MFPAKVMKLKNSAIKKGQGLIHVLFQLK